MNTSKECYKKTKNTHRIMFYQFIYLASVFLCVSLLLTACQWRGQSFFNVAKCRKINHYPKWWHFVHDIVYYMSGYKSMISFSSLSQSLLIFFFSSRSLLLHSLTLIRVCHLLSLLHRTHSTFWHFFFFFYFFRESLNISLYFLRLMGGWLDGFFSFLLWIFFHRSFLSFQMIRKIHKVSIVVFLFHLYAYFSNIHEYVWINITFEWCWWGMVVELVGVWEKEEWDWFNGLHEQWMIWRCFFFPSTQKSDYIDNIFNFIDGGAFIVLKLKGKFSSFSFYH